jgi:uncharacterized protein (TIGR02421 family)
MGTVTGSRLIERVIRAFRADEHVRERLPDGGVLNLDRRLPFLFVHRTAPARVTAGAERLVLGEASYLVAEGESTDELRPLVHALAEAAVDEFGAFLLFELWSGDDDSRRFVVHAPPPRTDTAAPASSSVDMLARGLAELGIEEQTDVVVETGDERHAPDLPPLLTARECFELGCLALGLEVPPIYRNAGTGDVYPVFLRRLRNALSPVLRQATFEFTRVQTSASIASFRALGPRSFGRAVADADRELTAIERSYDLLLALAPLNSAEALARFRDDGCSRPPVFRYRLLPVDPDLLRRRLYAIDLEDVADPAMAFLLRDKRDELDRQIGLLADRNSWRFRFGSMRLYGHVDDRLLHVARELLDTVRVPRAVDPAERVGAAEFAQLARAELEHYRGQFPGLAADVQLPTDLTGLMVSRGNLLIGHRLALAPHRVQPLLHHEVGTHVLTWYNGRAQPLQQLYAGLADYDELQEGLAVLSEYLVGGLDAARMRVLAARVVAAHSVEQGADFVETFRLLRDAGFSVGGAFDITERVHQSGGYTRDLIYLRGLLRLIDYLRDGGALEPLYIGKIAARHVDMIEELRARGFLRPPPLLPRVFELPETAPRLERLRAGLPLTGMISAA